MAASALSLPVVQKLFTLVINPIVQIIFAAAIIYFVYGVFKFIQDKANGESADIHQGANHVLWSTVGLFIMISVWGIISVLQRTIGGFN